MNRPSPVTVPELDFSGISHAFFTRAGGVSEGIYSGLNGGLGSNDSAEAVRENRRRMAAHLGVEPDRLLSLWQVHSPDVIVVDGPWTGDRPKADGLVTRTPGLAIGAASADCGPVLFADGTAGVIGACHSGWKGAFSGVLGNTLDAMEGLGARRDRIVAVLGPTISRDAYEVGPEFKARFEERDPALLCFFTPSERPGHAMFDLPGFIGAELVRAGVGLFVDTGLCTYADEVRFYSYRRTTHRGEPDYGRLISAIALKR
jgi:YfiH family protein